MGILSAVGSGCPDVVVGVSGISVIGDKEKIIAQLANLKDIKIIEGVNLLVEIKDGKKPPSKKKLTEHEEKFHAGWLGQVAIIEDEKGFADLLHLPFVDKS